MTISPVFFFVLSLRKMFFAIFLVFLNDFPFANLIAFMIINVAMMIFYLKKKPFSKKIYLIKEVICEFCFFSIHAMSFPFLIFDQKQLQKDDRNSIGLCIIILCTIILILQVIVML